MSDVPHSIAEIPVMPVIGLLYVLGHREPHGVWGTWFSGFDNSVLNAMPVGTTEIRARAFMRVLSTLNLVEGCHCGCRGDYELTNKGTAYFKGVCAESRS